MLYNTNGKELVEYAAELLSEINADIGSADA